MSQLTAAQLSDIQAACEAGAGDAAEVFSRALDAQLTLSVAGNGSVDPASLPEGFDTAGLVVLLDVEGTAAVLVIAESTGLLPEWYADPDTTGKNKLTTMAQELGMTLLPEALRPETPLPTTFQAARVAQLAEALQRGGLAEGAASVQLALQKDGGEVATVHLIFPLPNASDVLVDPKAAETDAASGTNTASAAGQDEAAANTGTKSPAATTTPQSRSVTSVDDLPEYAQSLLQIKVPVQVTLASKRQPLRNILELNAGTIIQFEKSCEELLDLHVGDHRVGRGEAVKVGDKFGIRLTSIVLPDERFGAVAAPNHAIRDEPDAD
jgi:flagellar motor switch protein FliN/FliY